MILRNRILVAGAIAVVAATATVAVLWTLGGVQSGPGPYANQLELCRERVAQDIQHIDHEHIVSAGAKLPH
ncbi:MAG: hypothetical protein O3C09_02365 [Proteobacteria bacterium]|nr:hypothetical protein [Pseudomonadota bacterium]